MSTVSCCGRFAKRRNSDMNEAVQKFLCTETKHHQTMIVSVLFHVFIPS